MVCRIQLRDLNPRQVDIIKLIEWLAQYSLTNRNRASYPPFVANNKQLSKFLAAPSSTAPFTMVGTLASSSFAPFSTLPSIQLPKFFWPHADIIRQPKRRRARGIVLKQSTKCDF